MAKEPKKKRVVRTAAPKKKAKLRSKKAAPSKSSDEALLFSKQNYLLMLAGLGIVVLGFILMSGGSMPDDNTWDESIIYSPIRITLAPLLVLSGFSLGIYAIFKKDKASQETASPKEEN